MIRILLALWLAWQTASPEALQHLQAGAEADKQRHFDVAIAEFKKVTELEPSLPDGFVNLGQAYMENRDYGAAIAPLKRAVQLAPDLAAAHQLLGYALLAQGYNAEAIPHLEKVQEQTALGIAQIGTGTDCSRQSNIFRQRWPNIPTIPICFTILAGPADCYRSSRLTRCWLHIRIQRGLIKPWRKITLCCDRCPRPRRNSAKHCGCVLILRNCISNSAWCTRVLRSGPKPRRSFAPSPRCEPGNAEAAYRLGSALLQQGKAREARTELERSNRLQPDMPETLYSLGKAAALAGDSATAEKVLDQTALDREAESTGGTDALRSRRPLSQAGKDRRSGTRDPGISKATESNNSNRKRTEIGH